MGHAFERDDEQTYVVGEAIFEQPQFDGGMHRPRVVPFAQAVGEHRHEHADVVGLPRFNGQPRRLREMPPHLLVELHRGGEVDRRTDGALGLHGSETDRCPYYLKSE